MQTLKSLVFLVKTAVKFRNSRINKILNTDTNRFFSNSFQVYGHIFEIYIVWKKKSELKLLFGKIKNGNNNPLLSKFMFKYIVCYQVFPIYMGFLLSKSTYKVNIFVYLALFYPRIHNGKGKKLTNNYM